MKRVISLLICFVIVTATLGGCGKSTIERYPDNYETADGGKLYDGQDGGGAEQIPPQKNNQQFFTGQKYLDSIKTSHSPYPRVFETDGTNITAYGSFPDDSFKYLMLTIGDSDEDMFVTKIENRSYTMTEQLPQDVNEIYVKIYGGQAEYGHFDGILTDYIKLERVGGKWQFVNSPIYDGNVALYTKAKNPADELSATDRIQSDDPEIIKLSNDITAGITDDYQKVKAIHDWVAENIYYDYDAFKVGNYDNLDAKNMLRTKKGVCEGYANLFAALVRAQNIPCRKQGGYALGVGVDKEWNQANLNVTESNHAWNEVFLDNRWIIIDSTWDSPNKYEYGKYEKGNFISQVYFDSTMEFFSLSHRSMEE